VYDHTIRLTAAYFSVYGSADSLLFGANSLAINPNGEGLIFDAAYLPFSNGGPALWPWAIARIGVSYTHYLKLFGGVNNFDGASHNASQNNTLFALYLDRILTKTLGESNPRYRADSQTVALPGAGPFLAWHRQSHRSRRRR
jgi:hypothetical protein